MGLLSFLKREPSTPAAKPVSDARDAVQQLRVRARRRLIGAAVLVAIAVIGFPLLFETQPRPIPVDLPIDIPRKEAAPVLAIPAPTPSQPASVAALVVPEPAPERGAVGASTAPVAVEPPAAKPVEKVAAKPIEKAADKPKPAVDPAAQARAPADSQEAARVQALLEGRAGEKKSDKKPDKKLDSADRFIVQVGAYADGKAAQEVRAKLERMGLKTYTQAVDTADGRRIRVRVGPFASREEADKVSAKVRSAGLSTAVLTL